MAKKEAAKAKKIVEAKTEKTEENKATPKPKRAKVRLVSPSNPELWVRAYVDVIEKYGAPLDPQGQPMVPGKAARGGGRRLSDEERAARAKAKAEEKAKFDAMSDEEKLEFARQKREKRAAERKAKKERERQELIAHIKAEIEAGRL